MFISETHTKVLIVGAGPSGLMMAAQLLRYGVQPIIIDSKQGPTDQSRALAVQARSLEIYRQMGVADRILKDGKQAKGASFNLDGKQAAEMSLRNVGEGQTAFPFIQLYQQSKNERLLLDFLTHYCCPVYWETTLLWLKQNAWQAEVLLQKGRQQISLACDWVIGADGAHSAVRKQLQIPFSGDTYQHSFYLADVELNNPGLDNDEVQLYLTKKGFAGFFPMPETNCFRIIGAVPDEQAEKDDLKLEDVLPYMDEVTRLAINVVRNNWFTIYKLHHRKADKFREQRCFLIGDAAHIHSPVGGQGMNTGLQDAYNLAWKLAGVVNWQFNEPILNSYTLEREPVAKDLLSSTDRIFTLITSRNWFAGLFKKWIMPVALKMAWGNKGIRESFFKRVSQIGINYRESLISLHISQATKIKAGDRLPYLKVFDEKKQLETDLHEWCSKPGFTLIALGKLTDLNLFAIAKWITQSYPAILNFYYLPSSAKNQAIFDVFEIKENQHKALIVRPDMHIGFINDAIDIVLMDNYLQNVVKVISKQQP